MTVLVTGGAGFIGSALVRHLVATGRKTVCVDKLTYAGNLASISSVADDPSFEFVQADICDQDAVAQTFKKFTPSLIYHLAAETHVDRSIEGPLVFARTNVVGTAVLLQEATRYRDSLSSEAQNTFRFLSVSTDEVFGELGDEGLFSESSPYAPNSPYSASKASTDHFVRAWHRTYGLPIFITNCSNNYGPCQNREKLIPTVIRCALAGMPIPIYGTGENVRDWLHVDDHVRALELVAESGRIGETFNIGGSDEITNIELVRRICKHLDHHSPRTDARSYEEQIRFVTDRPGHDARYAIDASKIRTELGWKPDCQLESALEGTVAWYLANPAWLGN